MDWMCGSSSRMPTLQAQSSEFKSQSQQQQQKEMDASIAYLSI
jgi:hypothetical protein